MDFSTPPSSRPSVETKQLPGELAIRQMVLKAFCDPFPEECLRLQSLSQRQWRHLLRWLDISGLALYFLYRILELQRGYLLPAPVFDRLEQNLKDNSERTRSMIAETVAIQSGFQAANLRYAILKGLSLWPNSTPSANLRSQFDIDFLVAPENIHAAQNILVQRGYRLYSNHRRSWEFKRNERPGISLKDIYKDLSSWRVELHAASAEGSALSPLDRLEWRELSGFKMPVLSPVDLFLGHGLHTFKHICSEFSRASHLLEFRRHVLFRRADEAFWTELKQQAAGNPRARVGLGVPLMLLTQWMGDFAPDALTEWTVRRLPRSANLWVRMYGHNVVLGSFPGTKLYLLLQNELRTEGLAAPRSLPASLLPRSLPPPVIRRFANENFHLKVGRYLVQLNLVFTRLRFHLVEGLRFARESRRWRRALYAME
jgi:hypothetical protein